MSQTYYRIIGANGLYVEGQGPRLHWSERGNFYLDFNEAQAIRDALVEAGEDCDIEPTEYEEWRAMNVARSHRV